MILKKFISVLSEILQCAELKNAVDSVPNVCKSLLKYVGLECSNITLYVVCPTCGCVYNLEQCIETRAGHTVALKCRYVAFPNHSQCDLREPCNSPLLKEIKIGSRSKRVFAPIKAYPYQSLKAAITDLVLNPDFLILCDHWRNDREVPDGVLADVYDGSAWKDFSSDKYMNFLRTPGNLLLSMNTDWFKDHIFSWSDIFSNLELT